MNNDRKRSAGIIALVGLLGTATIIPAVPLGIGIAHNIPQNYIPIVLTLGILALVGTTGVLAYRFLRQRPISS